MVLKDSDKQKAARAFFRAEGKNLESASRAVIKTGAEALAREVKKQLRQFKRSPGSKFAKAVKVYNYPPKGAWGPTSFVRLRIKWLDAFEEGKTVRGKEGRLIILLDPGRKLGFKRISKSNPWRDVWRRLEGRVFLSPTSGGMFVIYRTDEGTNVPIYKFQEQVKVPKKLRFRETAEHIANEMPEQIRQLL